MSKKRTATGDPEIDRILAESPELDESDADEESDAEGVPDDAPTEADSDSSDDLDDVEALADIMDADVDVDMAGFSSCEEALEKAVTDLERVVSERNEYLDLARRVQADFENFKRRTDTQRSEVGERANESLVVELLPVLDACAAATAGGSSDVAVIEASLRSVLSKLGLTSVDESGITFDPMVHDAVLSEPGDGDDGETVVAEIMRPGYVWRGRVVRPAMVKVRG